ncbi:hypothetical protein PIB30_031157 [Stylosanthes scabra]|uniref:K Homology domain-containing protein n=1 Tax=Stylosanthes scabra TaxID=79078 RepID=A0ABU6ZBX1_9FABA|nr:hypothetical protein [Stylosanthes scabra]
MSNNKRPPDPAPLPGTATAKRRHFLPETVFRIVCPTSRIADLTALTTDGVKILVDESAPPISDHECILVVVTAPSEQPPITAGDCEGGAEASPPQQSLLRVLERIVDHDEHGSNQNANSTVSFRFVAPSYHVGCVVGRGGKIVERIRQESGASVRVFSKDQVPLPPPGDEFIQISGSFGAVKKALLSVSACILEKEASNSGSFKSSGPGGHHGAPPPHHVEPHRERYGPDSHTRGYAPFPGPENAGHGHRPFIEEDVVFKLLCQQDKVGSLIGKGGSVVRAMQNDTGASIQIVDTGPDSEERVVVIAARENSDLKHSPAQDAVIRVHNRLTEIGFEPSAAVIARLLVRSPQVGCLLGKGGLVISEMRRATGASIRIFSKEQIKFISQNEEVVQVIGNLQSVQDALFQITSRIRETIFPMRTPPNFSAPPHMPPFPDMPPPSFRPRNHLMPSGHPPPPVGPPHGIDHSAVPPPPPDQHAFSHGMGCGPPNMDRAPYPRGYEGPNSPRLWNPMVVNRGNPGGLADPSSLAPRNGTPGKNGNSLHSPNNSNVEVTIPHMYLTHVYGENNSNLVQIQQISGANVVVHDSKPGAAECIVSVSGAPDQTQFAQSLIQAFILCGQTAA